MTVLDLVREAFETLAEFLSGSSQMEAMDANVRAKMHAFVHKQLQASKGSHRCIVSGCEFLAIQRSHTIQRAGPLQRIAENEFVLAPRHRPSEYGLIMRRVPRASTALTSTDGKVEQNQWLKLSSLYPKPYPGQRRPHRRRLRSGKRIRLAAHNLLHADE